MCEATERCRDCGTDCNCCLDAYPEAGYCCECGPKHRDDPRMVAIGQGTEHRRTVTLGRWSNEA